MSKEVAKVARIINCHDVPGKRSYDADVLMAISCGGIVSKIKNNCNQAVNFDNNKKESNNFGENR